MSSEWKNISEESLKKLEHIVEREMPDAGRDPGQSGSDGERQDPPVYPELQVRSGT